MVRIFQWSPPWLWLVLVCSSAALLGACGARRTAKMGGDDGPKDQWSQGVWVYGQQCAGCHGEEGQGDDEDIPPLVGDGSLPPRAMSADSSRKIELNTAHDLFAYTSAHMPPLGPGGLSEQEYWALTAYILFLRNGERRAEPLGPEEAKRIELHP